jgi:probable F420-dependent oxidoreductase
MKLGKIGVWWSKPWKAGDLELDIAAEMETLGYSALWSGGGFERGLSKRFESQLASTSHVVVASGIVNIWRSSPEELAQAAVGLEERYPGRFLLGLGTSHAVLVKEHARPYAQMVGYLDALDSAGPAVARDRRVLGALGPRMLKLAGDRTAGAHPYCVPPEHTARARGIMGPDALLAPAVTVVLEREPDTARELARTFTQPFLSLPEYASNLRSLGFSQADLAGGGSDRLVDAVVCWGDPDTVASKVHEHIEAGADHVCIEVVATPPRSFPLDQYRALAPVLLTS